MRLKQVSVSAAISVVAGLTTATVGLAAPAAWADSTASLPLSHYAHMVADPAHQHLFFSQGAGSTGILVTDLSGTPVTTLTDEQGATGLALSADGSTLYAALADGDAVAAVDTATLTESARYATGTGSAPVSVAVAGGKVWYGYETADGKGAIGSVDASGTVSTPSLSHWSVPPVLAAGGGVLAAEEPLQSLSHVATFDVSSGTATAKADTDVAGGTATGLQVTADGARVLLAATQQPALQVYRTSDLLGANPAPYYTGAVGPASLAIDTDGTVASASTAGLYLYAGSNLAENHVTFPSGTTVAPDGLTWGGDGTTLYAVTRDSAGAYTLDVLGSAKLSDTTLTTNPPRYAAPTEQFTVTGALATRGFLPSGAVLQVTRDGDPLPDATVGADGTFSISDTRPDAGQYTYQVSYAGDATHRPATATQKVYVARLSTDIAFPEIASATPHSVVLKDTLTTELLLGSLRPGTEVDVTRTNEDTQETVQLASVPVDPDTTEFTVTDDPGAAGRFTYHLSFAGDATHEPTTSDATLQISPYTPALTLKAPASATRAAALSFTGDLGDGPYPAGETVTVTRTDAAHVTTPATWTAPVAADGTITVKDAPAVGGANTYTVSYPGDAVHQAATASAIVQVSRVRPTVTVTTDKAGYAYDGTATVTAHLGTTYNGRTVSVYATPVGGRKTLLKTGTVDSKGNLKVTYKLTHNTTFTASFAGDYRYAPATATHSATARVRIAEKLGGYYTSTTYSGVTYRVYHHTVRPQVVGTVTPDKSGQCMKFQAQEYYSGAWHTIGTSSCFSMAPGSTGVTHLVLTHAVNQRFRVRTEYVHSSKDTSNADTWGGWLYLTVRN
ncbi:hypothetical protein [Streptomyces sp. NPDC002172]